MAPATDEPIFFYLKRHLPPPDGTNLLGRVISDYRDPTRDSTPICPSSTLTPPGPAFEDFLLAPQYIDHARLVAQTTCASHRHLAFLARRSASSATDGTTTVTSARITTRRLQHETDYFARLKAVPDVRRQLLTMCDVGDEVYLVVGTMSLQTGTFHSTTLTRRSTNTGAIVPLALAASAAAIGVGAPLPFAGEVVPDAEASVGRVNTTRLTESFSIGGEGEDGGEKVFAIACRVVTRTLLGVGKDMRIGGRQPEYTGGRHFGIEDRDEESDQESMEAELGEEAEASLAQGLNLIDDELVVFEEDEGIVFHPDDWNTV